jgi:hypothetical protein
MCYLRRIIYWPVQRPHRKTKYYMSGVSLMALDDVLILLARKVDVNAISYLQFSISIPRVTSINRQVHQIPKSVNLCTRFAAPVLHTYEFKSEAYNRD